MPTVDLDNPEGDPDEEVLDKYAQDTMRVQTLCQLAEMHIDDFDDEYEVNKFNERVTEATKIARNIPDDFLQAAALGFLIELYNKAGLSDEEKQLRNEIEDPGLLELVTKNTDEESV